MLILAGKYIVTSPIDLVSHLTLDLEPGSILEVPNGYASYVFGLGGDGPPKFGVHHTHIQGGVIQRNARTDIPNRTLCCLNASGPPSCCTWSRTVVGCSTTPSEMWISGIRVRASSS